MPAPNPMPFVRAGDDVATNTDTIILMRIPNNGESATAISIPRDSYVTAPGFGKTKINGVFGEVKLEEMNYSSRSRARIPPPPNPRPPRRAARR